MTDENPFGENLSDEPWAIADMLPIAIAHAEAAAKAAGLSVGEWLAQLIAASAPPLASPLTVEDEDSEKPTPAS